MMSRLFRQFLIFVALLSDGSRAIAEDVIKNTPGSHIGTQNVAQMAGGLILVLLLIFLAAWLVKRFQPAGFTTKGKIKIVASMALGTREKLIVVEVSNEQLLLGVGARGIQHLHTLEENIASPQQDRTNKNFSQQLHAILHNTRQSGIKTTSKSSGAPQSSTDTEESE